MKKQPSVSIIIPNYNHSRFLDDSIQSALSQTYGNIEIIVNDNCSTDSSVETVAEYLSKGVIINKNPTNVLNYNYNLAYSRCSGKYFVLLCADDVLKPDFVERTVRIMEQHEDIAFVHGERDYIDESGGITELDPFFDRSFTASGESMLPIFMLTDIGQSAQGLIRRSAFERAGCHDTDHDHLNIDREQWFRLCMEGDYAYLREKMTLIRTPASASQTSITVKSMYHPFALYVTVKGFVEWGKLRNYPEVVNGEQKAMEKMSKECLAMAESLMADGEFDTVQKYLLFMPVAYREIILDERYKQLKDALARRNNDAYKTSVYGGTNNFKYHKRSYKPPKSFIELRR